MTEEVEVQIEELDISRVHFCMTGALPHSPKSLWWDTGLFDFNFVHQMATRYHTIQIGSSASLHACTIGVHTHTHASHSLIFVTNSVTKTRVFTPGLAPEVEESIHTNTHRHTGGHTLPLTPPTPDICHFQSVLQARHLSSVVLPLWRTGLQKEKARLQLTERERESCRLTETGRQEEERTNKARELLLAAACPPTPLTNW